MCPLKLAASGSLMPIEPQAPIREARHWIGHEPSLAARACQRDSWKRFQRGPVGSESNLTSRTVSLTLPAMPRHARIDAPGALHHVMGRGIAGIKLFHAARDCEDFLARLVDLCGDGHLQVYVWALRVSRPAVDLDGLARKISHREGAEEAGLRFGSRRRRVSEARKIFCQTAVT